MWDEASRGKMPAAPEEATVGDAVWEEASHMLLGADLDAPSAARRGGQPVGPTRAHLPLTTRFDRTETRRRVGLGLAAANKEACAMVTGHAAAAAAGARRVESLTAE